MFFLVEDVQVFSLFLFHKRPSGSLRITSCYESGSRIHTSAESQLQNKGARFPRETLMNIFTHEAKERRERSYVYSWLRVAMTWSEVLRSPRPMKLQEALRGIG